MTAVAPSEFPGRHVEFRGDPRAEPVGEPRGEHFVDGGRQLPQPANAVAVVSPEARSCPIASRMTAWSVVSVGPEAGSPIARPPRR